MTADPLTASYSYALINPPISAPGGYRSVSLSAINNDGDILGSVNTPGSRGVSGTTVPFLYHDGSYTTLAVPDAVLTTASRLDEAGRVIGTYDDGLGRHAYVYQNGTYTQIDAPGAQLTTLLQGTASGLLLGTAFDSRGLHPFIDDNGQFTTLAVPGARGTFVSAPYSGSSINEAGDVIGAYTDQTGTHAFLYHSGAYTTLAFPGASSTTAASINKSGDVLEATPLQTTLAPIPFSTPMAHTGRLTTRIAPETSTVCS